MSTALVTGASSGIGEAFARALAARGHDLVLVARTTARLQTLAAELTDAHRIECEVMTADLGDRRALATVEARLSDPLRAVDVLVNSAGFALKQRFVGGDVEVEQHMIDVMVTAVMRLTHAALPHMRDRGHGLVINVSSVAGWSSGSTYNAAKAWVTTFSEGLSQSLQSSGVTVTAACPGFTHTEFHERADIREESIPNWMWIDTDDVVSTALADAAKGRPISVPTARYKTLSLLMQYAPRPLVRRASGAPRGRRRPRR